MPCVFSSKRLRLGLLSVVVSLLLLLFSTFNVQAATVGITVDVTTDTGGAGCELREAIQSANTEVAVAGCTFSVAPTAGADDFVITIDAALFPAVINLNNELPAFQQPIHLIGGDVLTDDITIRPAGSAGALSYGLRLGAGSGDSRIQGLVIDGFGIGVDVIDVADNALLANDTQIGLAVGAGGNKIINNGTGILIRGTNSDNISIANNIIGISDPVTPTLAGNSLDGIRVMDARNVDIGIGAGNIIGGNGRYGIYLHDSDFVNLESNIIGRSPLSADFAAGNAEGGIRVSGGSSNVNIGDGTAGGQNTVGSNSGIGILVGNSSNVVIDTNLIGETFSGFVAGNASAGIWITGSGVEVTNNVIAHNLGDGVVVRTGLRNEISQNSIYENARLGIDLNDDSLTENDLGDADTGPNNLQNFPSVTAAWVVGANLFINGRMNSIAGSYRMEIYNNPSGCNPPTGNPLYGEGEVFEQSITVGTGPFSLSLPVGGFAAGDILTMLAISSDGNTSEFSHCVTILNAPPTATPTPSATAIPTTAVPIVTTAAPIATTAVATTAVATTVVPTTLVPTTIVPTTAVPTTAVPSLVPTTVVPTTVVPPTLVPTTVVPPTVVPTVPSITPIPTLVPTLVPTITASFTPRPSSTPDIDITKVSDGDDDVVIDIVNNGDGTAPNVIVIEDLRDDVEYRAATLGDATCLETAGIVTCFVGDIPAGATAQVGINVDSNGVDPASGQTTVTVGGVTVAIVDEPYIIKVGNPPVAAPGAEITYTIRVINPTTESAFNMLIEDEMPEGIEIISGAATDGELEIDGQSVRLSLGELAPNGRVTITLITRVSDEEIFPQIVNTACVTSSSNPAPRCAQMSFLRAGQLPTTGETPLIYRLLLWAGIALITALMLSGLFFFWRRTQRV